MGKTEEKLLANKGNILEKHGKGIGKPKEKQSKNIRQTWGK